MNLLVVINTELNEFNKDQSKEVTEALDQQKIV